MTRLTNILAAHTIAGAALVGAILTPTAAWASCSAANQYTFSFNSLAVQTLAYGTTYTYAATSTALGNLNFNVATTQNGLSSTTAGGEVRPNISTSHNGGGTTKTLVVGGILSGRTASITGATNVMVTTFTFLSPVRDVVFTVHDVDFTANQFRDWMHVVGINGASNYVPSLTTPWGQVNVTGPFTNGSSSLTLGPNTVPGTVTSQQGVGTGTSGNNSTTGNVNVSFAEPVTSVQVRYGNYPYTSGENSTGQQAYALSGVSWCPMPVLTVGKTSAPYVTTAGDPLRFAAPGSDIAYSLTVTNSNSSPVDLNLTVLNDILPSTLTFRNSDFDDAGPLTTNFEFTAGTSGLTMAAANVTYSSTGGSTYVYTPSAGYDAAVNAIRLNPQGAMAANSSFTIRFRAQVK